MIKWIAILPMSSLLSILVLALHQSAIDSRLVSLSYAYSLRPLNPPSLSLSLSFSLTTSSFLDRVSIYRAGQRFLVVSRQVSPITLLLSLLLAVPYRARLPPQTTPIKRPLQTRLFTTYTIGNSQTTHDTTLSFNCRL